MAIPIYKSTRGKYESYTLSYYRDGRRVRRSFSDLKAAEQHARQAASKISSGRARETELSSRDYDTFRWAQTALESCGVSFDEAIREFVQAKKILHGESLLPACQNFARLYLNTKRGQQVSSVAEECLASKRSQGLSGRYLKQLESDLTRFSKAFSKDIADVSSTEMSAWLQSLVVNNRSRNNMLCSIRTFFHFAQKQAYLPKNVPTEADDLEKFKVVPSRNEVFTPAQMLTLLNSSKGEETIWLAVGGFAGLRSAEIARMRWEWFNFDSGYITVWAQEAKTSSRRLVPISENLSKCLEPLRKEEGQLLSDREVWKDVTALAKRLGLGWPRNVLRNSRISYRLAQTKDIGLVAEESGNSSNVIRKDYLELVTPADADAWFKVVRNSRLTAPVA